MSAGYQTGYGVGYAIGHSFGLIIGGIFVGAVFGLLPMILAFRKRRGAIAWTILGTCILAGLVRGLFLAIPVAVAWLVVVLVIRPNPAVADTPE